MANKSTKQSRREKIDPRICPLGMHNVRTIIGYKGYWKAIKEGKKPDPLQKLQDYYHNLSRN